MKRSPRSGLKLSTHELARFLALLAETGNFALACDRLGRSKSGLYKRRVRDPFFDSECVAALAVFRMSPVRPERSRGASPPSLKTVSSEISLGSHAGRPQLRRSAPGGLTRAGLDTFLKTLAATANVRFSAASVGIAPSSIYARRRRDPDFAKDMEAAIDAAIAGLEMRVIEASGVFADDDDAGAELAEGCAIEKLTAAEALHFLTLHARAPKQRRAIAQQSDACVVESARARRRASERLDREARHDRRHVGFTPRDDSSSEVTPIESPTPEHVKRQRPEPRIRRL